MAVAASGQGGVMVRVDPDETEVLLTHPHASPMVMSGRAVRGWIRVAGEGIGTDDELGEWVERGVAVVRGRSDKGVQDS